MPLLHYEYGGRIQGRVGINHATISPYGAYRCRDGLDIVIAIQNEREWQRFCAEVLGDAGLARDPQLADNESRVVNRARVDELVGAAFAVLDQAQAAELLRRADIAYGRLNDIAGLAGHPQLRRSSVDTPSGEAHLVAAAAIRVGETGRRPSVPSLGQHSARIREEFN